MQYSTPVLSQPFSVSDLVHIFLSRITAAPEWWEGRKEIVCLPMKPFNSILVIEYTTARWIKSFGEYTSEAKCYQAKLLSFQECWPSPATCKDWEDLGKRRGGKLCLYDLVFNLSSDVSGWKADMESSPRGEGVGHGILCCRCLDSYEKPVNWSVEPEFMLDSFVSFICVCV